ncbi:hypothetical protein [Acidovorax temperans]|uniref:hypothetical protein n=1 Tax=Acidovorax temperans TaxID=80878 RepID=UPI002898A1AB|nr:hypothetical protein [Acidovorax temperans]
MSNQKCFVLQRCIRQFMDGRATWQTISQPISYREGLSQLGALHDHNRDHRLLTDCPDAMPLGAIIKDRSLSSMAQGSVDR